MSAPYSHAYILIQLDRVETYITRKQLKPSTEQLLLAFSTHGPSLFPLAANPPHLEIFVLI
jgi:hypothetical protein